MSNAATRRTIMVSECGDARVLVGETRPNGVQLTVQGSICCFTAEAITDTITALQDMQVQIEEAEACGGKIYITEGVTVTAINTGTPLTGTQCSDKDDEQGGGE